jgi:predicted esterase
MTISRITGLNRRLQKLKDAAVTLKTETHSTTTTASDVTIAATLRDETRLIENVIAGIPQEADFPLLHRLRSCEAMLATRSKPSDFANQWAGAKEVWLTLSKGLRSVPTRIHLPGETDKPVPVLFVFHGAGGSENMFFETYGAGRVIDEAAKRGWIVISPRQGLFGLSLDIPEMLNALDAFVPFDCKRIMLLGHSMGASQALKQVRKHPTLPIAAVALGGGGRMPNSDAKRSQHVAWYIGAGDQDFGLAAAKQLKQSLEASEVSNRFKVYENVEHLVVVQAAIDDAFQFLDEAVGRLAEPAPDTATKAP